MYFEEYYYLNKSQFSTVSRRTMVMAGVATVIIPFAAAAGF
jgi:hypothetical protein